MKKNSRKTIKIIEKLELKTKKHWRIILTEQNSFWKNLKKDDCLKKNKQKKFRCFKISVERKKNKKVVKKYLQKNSRKIIVFTKDWKTRNDNFLKNKKSWTLEMSMKKNRKLVEILGSVGWKKKQRKI